jgi:hypothetical protein
LAVAQKAVGNEREVVCQVADIGRRAESVVRAADFVGVKVARRAAVEDAQRVAEPRQCACGSNRAHPHIVDARVQRDGDARVGVCEGGVAIAAIVVADFVVVVLGDERPAGVVERQHGVERAVYAERVGSILRQFDAEVVVVAVGVNQPAHDLHAPSTCRVHTDHSQVVGEGNQVVAFRLVEKINDQRLRCAQRKCRNQASE